MSASTAKARTVLELLRLTTTYLAGRGADTPRLDAEVLLAHVLGMDRVGLYVNFDRPLQPSEVDGYRDAVARRARREPVAYITGKKEFMGHDFAVSPAVLIPRPETELLVEKVLHEMAGLATSDVIRICDIGTGSGVIAISLAIELPQAEVVAVDLSPAALDVARANATKLGVAERVSFTASNLFTQLPPDAKFHCIVSNPPYIPTPHAAGLAPELRCEPQMALFAGADGLQIIRRLIAEAPKWLSDGGYLAMEIGDGQGAAVKNLGEAAGYASVIVTPDYAGRDRVALLRVAAEA